MQQVGIEVSLRNIDWGALLDAADRLEIPFWLGWVADYPDPDNFLHVLHTDNIGLTETLAVLAMLSSTSLLKARIETEPAVREELYKRLKL